MSEQITTIGAVSMIITSLMGVGIYYTPSAFAQSGFFCGTLILIGVTILSIFSIYAIFEASYNMLDRYNKSFRLPTTENEEECSLSSIQERSSNDDEENYIKSNPTSESDLSFANIGYNVSYALGHAINGTIVFSGISTCVYFQKFSAQITSALLSYSGKDDESKYAYNALVIFYGFLLLIVGQVKNLANIKWLSYINLLCISLICLMTCVLTFLLQGFVQQHPPSTTKHGYLYTFVAFILAMNCQQNVVSIFSVLKDKSKQNLMVVAALGSIITGALYFIIGNFGRILFGDDMVEIDIVSILINPNSSIRLYIALHHPYLIPVVSILCTLALIGLLIGLVYQQYAVTNVFKNLSKRFNVSDSAQTFFWTFVSVVCMTIFNMCVTVSLTEIFMLIGNYLVIPMSLIFPFIFLIAFSNKVSYTRTIGSILVIILGVIVALWNTADYYFNSSNIEKIDYGTSNLWFRTTLSA